MKLLGPCSTLALLLSIHPAAADDAALREARALYTRGIDLWRGQRCAEALPLLSRSNALAPSPNSALLIARCRASLGRLEAAAETYAEVVADAGARVAAGDTRYAATVETAQQEGAALRARLGVLRLRVTGSPSGATVETDAGVAMVVGEQAQLLHRPGDIAFTVRTPAGGVARGRARVEAGKFTSVTVSAPIVAPPAPPPSPSATTSSAPGWVLPAGIGAAALGVTAFAAFVGFGLAASGQYDEVASCLPGCEESKTPTIEGGRRDQAIANVSLGVAILATAVSVPLFVWSWPRAAETTGRRGEPPPTP